MAQQTLPRRPVENWEAQRDAWVQKVESTVRQAEEWARKQDWSIRRDTKTITEDLIGPYEVPVLLIHTPRGRLLFDPIARYVIGAEGRIDFCAMPSYDPIMLIKTGNSWEFESVSRRDLHLAWSEAAFGRKGNSLLSPWKCCRSGYRRIHRC